MITVVGSTLIVVPFIFDSFTIPKLLFMALGVTVIVTKLSMYGYFPRNTDKVLKWSSLLFLASILVSWLVSGLPLTRALIGQFGRGNGLAYYFLAICILTLSAILYSDSAGPRLHLGLTLLAWFLSIYAVLQRIGFDLAQLETRGLSSIVLTFGNSNFAGSMLSVLFAYHFAYSVLTKSFKAPQILLLITLLACSTLPAAFQGYLIIAFAVALSVTQLIYTTYSFRFSNAVLIVVWLSGLVLVFLGLIGKSIFAPIFSRTTFQIRIEYWKISLNVLGENPLFGVGPDKLYDYSSRYMAPGTLDLISNTRLDSAHNWFLNVMTNYGVLSFAFLAITLLWISSRAIKLLFDKSNKSPWGKSSAIAFFAVLISGMVSIEQPGIGIWLYFFGGVVVAASQPELSKPTGIIRQPSLSISKLQRVAKLMYIGVIAFLVTITIVLGNRLVLDGLLRSSIQTLMVGKGTPETLIDIEKVGNGLRSDPEYAVKALDVLAPLGAAKEIDGISRLTYEYDDNSIQANLIRADVLRALNRQQESCEMYFLLLPNTPWDPKLLRNYLVCLARGFEYSQSKDVLAESSDYLEDFEYSALEASVENFTALQQKAETASFRGRLEFELGNRPEALLYSRYARDCLAKILDIMKQNTGYETYLNLSEITILIDFQGK